MSDSWNEMRKAKEEAYFIEQNKAALQRIKNRNEEKPRLSPITGEPMEQVTIMGVVVDRCKKTNGIWLDAGELEEIVRLSMAAPEGLEKNPGGWFSNFLEFFSGENK
ncbi:MAG: zf-TFIIB domain-containing protein [Bdellovibrionales bacterium]|nr:zf-TFIIB domain-containing protein [Bdellovibrionales bacterium]